MFRIWNMSWETHCIRHQSLLHFPWSPIQIWPTRRQIVCMNLPEQFRGFECGMRPSEAVQSWVSSRHFTGHPIFNSRRTCGNRTPLFLHYGCPAAGIHNVVVKLLVQFYSWLDFDILIFCEATLHLHILRSCLSIICSTSHPCVEKTGSKEGIRMTRH